MLSSKIFQITIALLIAMVLISTFFNHNIKFEDLALGGQTKVYLARKDTQLIHFDNFSDFYKIEKSWNYFGGKNIILCLGNSQTHSINQMKSKEVTYVQMLSDTIKDKEVIAFTLPNISLQEMLLSFEYIRSKMPIKELVLPIFMDDLREDDIRADFFFGRLLSEKYKLQLESGAIASKINNALNKNSNSDNPNSDADLAGLNNTPQAKVETYFNTRLNSYSLVWRSRPEIRGWFFNYLYELRNTLFGINAQTKRAMIPQTYNNNVSAFKSILEISKKNNINVVAYIPPIRHDVEIPYDANEYENLKKQISNMCSEYENVKYLNLEYIVPSQYWGVKDGTNLSKKPELDFMHFQYEGHKILFRNLYPSIQKMNN